MRPGDSFVAQPVRSLQTMLRIIAMNNARISKAVPDGIYGPDTMQEVSALQRMSGLPQTGVVNEAIRASRCQCFTGTAGGDSSGAGRKNRTQSSKSLCFPPAKYAHSTIHGKPNHPPPRPLRNDG